MTRSMTHFPRRRTAPDAKRQMTLAQLAQAAGETVHAVRYYVRLGLVAPAGVAANGYRQFDPAAVARLGFIRRAQQLGFTLTEIGSFVEDARKGRSPCPRVRQLIESRLPSIAAQAEQTHALLLRMQAAARRWKRLPNSTPDGDAICRLIEGGATR